MEEGKHVKHRGHFWLGLSVGLFLGIALAISFYFVDKYAFIQTLHLQKRTEKPTTDTIVQIVEKNNYYRHVENEPKPATAAEQPADTLVALAEEVDTELDTDDLLLDSDDTPTSTTALKTKGIANKRIKVHNMTAATAPFDFFDVEQWNEPVKNRFSYQRTKNVLKIKGFDIQEIELKYDGADYLLTYKGHTFHIPENGEFTRLSN